MARQEKGKEMIPGKNRTGSEHSERLWGLQTVISIDKGQIDPRIWAAWNANTALENVQLVNNRTPVFVF